MWPTLLVGLPDSNNRIMKILHRNCSSPWTLVIPDIINLTSKICHQSFCIQLLFCSVFGFHFKYIKYFIIGVLGIKPHSYEANPLPVNCTPTPSHYDVNDARQCLLTQSQYDKPPIILNTQ